MTAIAKALTRATYEAVSRWTRVAKDYQGAYIEAFDNLPAAAKHAAADVYIMKTVKINHANIDARLNGHKLSKLK